MLNFSFFLLFLHDIDKLYRQRTKTCLSSQWIDISIKIFSIFDMIIFFWCFCFFNFILSIKVIIIIITNVKLTKKKSQNIFENILNYDRIVLAYLYQTAMYAHMYVYRAYHFMYVFMYKVCYIRTIIRIYVCMCECISVIWWLFSFVNKRKWIWLRVGNFIEKYLCQILVLIWSW